MLLMLLVGLVLMREAREQPGARVEEAFINWLAANTSRVMPTPPLALIEIDDSSLSSGHAWPWSPFDFALFLETSLSMQPAVIGIEPVLEWDERTLSPAAKLKLPQYEKILHDRILRAPKILLGARLGFPEDPDIIPPLQPVPVLRQIKGEAARIPQFTAITHEPKEELRLAATLGFANVPAPAHGALVQRAPLLFAYRGQVVPSFALQAMMLWLAVTPDEVKVDLGSRIDMGGKMSIPIDAAGGMLVDFKSPFTRVGFDDLLLAKAQIEAKKTPIVTPGELREKFVLLARTDAASRTVDLPIGRKGSPGELFAAAIATMQNQTFIHRIGPWFDGCVILCAMLLGAFLYRRTLRVVLAAGAFALAAYLLIGLAVFKASLLALPMLLPTGLALFGILFRILAPRASAPPPRPREEGPAAAAK